MKNLAPLLRAGCVPRSRPPVRSSSYKAVTQPLLYVLTEKLGIYPWTTSGKALSTGSWFHKRAELWDSPASVVARVQQQLLDARLAELREGSKLFGMTADTRDAYLHNEEHDCRTAFAWWDAACQVRRFDKAELKDGFMGYLSSNRFQCLGHESRICIPCLDGRVMEQYTSDVVLYDFLRGGVWLTDFKTTSDSPYSRGLFCPKEWQARLALTTGRAASENKLFTKHLSSPTDNFLGVIHIIIQRPSIRFGMLDRPFSLDTSPFKSGPRKGQPRNDKVYSGEPSVDLYIERCRRWYLGLEEFQHKGPAVFGPDCPVNVSYTPIGALTYEDWRKFERERRRVWGMSLSDSEKLVLTAPERIEVEMSSTYGESPYLDFYLVPPSAWPEVMRRRKLIFNHRDSELDSVMEPTIISASQVEPLK